MIESNELPSTEDLDFLIEADSTEIEAWRARVKAETEPRKPHRPEVVPAEPETIFTKP